MKKKIQFYILLLFSLCHPANTNAQFMVEDALSIATATINQISTISQWTTQFRQYKEQFQTINGYIKEGRAIIRFVENADRMIDKCQTVSQSLKSMQEQGTLTYGDLLAITSSLQYMVNYGTEMYDYVLDNLLSSENTLSLKEREDRLNEIASDMKAKLDIVDQVIRLARSSQYNLQQRQYASAIMDAAFGATKSYFLIVGKEKGQDSGAGNGEVLENGTVITRKGSMLPVVVNKIPGDMTVSNNISGFYKNNDSSKSPLDALLAENQAALNSGKANSILNFVQWAIGIMMILFLGWNFAKASNGTNPQNQDALFKAFAGGLAMLALLQVFKVALGNNMFII